MKGEVVAGLVRVGDREGLPESDRGRQGRGRSGEGRGFRRIAFPLNPEFLGL